MSEPQDSSRLINRRSSEDKLIAMLGSEAKNAAHASVTNDEEKLKLDADRMTAKRNSIDKIAGLMGEEAAKNVQVGA